MPRRTNLDLDLVRAFLVVCEQRSFTRAGERLGRSQSAVSLQVRRLEEQLGQPLLSRDPRHVAPTEQGAAFLPQARRLLRLNDEILASLGADEIEGEVRLGAPEDFATQHLPSVLGSFARSHPRIALTVTCDLTLTLLDRLSEGALDWDRLGEGGRAFVLRETGAADAEALAADLARAAGQAEAAVTRLVGAGNGETGDGPG